MRFFRCVRKFPHIASKRAKFFACLGYKMRKRMFSSNGADFSISKIQWCENFRLLAPNPEKNRTIAQRTWKKAHDSWFVEFFASLAENFFSDEEEPLRHRMGGFQSFLTGTRLGGFSATDSPADGRGYARRTKEIRLSLTMDKRKRVLFIVRFRMECHRTGW